MSRDRLSDPPMIVTDLPTNYHYGTPYIATGGVPGDFGRRYREGGNNQTQVFNDICIVPNSFGVPSLRHGICVGVKTFATDSTNAFNASVMIHPPTHSLSQYAKSDGWTPIDGVQATHWVGNFGEGRVDVRVFAQRQGEWIYAVLGSSQEGNTGLIGVKFNRFEFAQTWYNAGFYLSDYAPVLDPKGQFFVSDDEEPFIWSAAGNFDRPSSGDDLANGTMVFGFVDDGSPIGTYVFRDDRIVDDTDSPSNGRYLSPGTGYHYTGKSGAFRQKFQMPINEWGMGPYLTHAWRCGAYGAPELWFYIIEFDTHGRPTGMLDIYRSEWQRGAYRRYDNPAPDKPLGYVTQVGHPDGPPTPVDPTTFNFHPDRPRSFLEMPVVLDDDLAYNLGPYFNGGQRFPTLNPNGYAFESTWFDRAHHVGRVGPVTMQILSPRSGPEAAAYNSRVLLTGQPRFSFGKIQVVRDKKRRGVLHMVIAGDVASGLASDIPTHSPGFYFAQSGDDGRTWSRLSPVQPPPHPAPQKIDSNNIVVQDGQINLENFAIARLYEDHTIMPIGYTVIKNVDTGSGAYPDPDTGTRGALVAVDYIATGVGKHDLKDPVYKRGELNRASWV